MSIKNYLKDKISKKYNNNEIDNNNNLNKNNDVEMKNNITQVQISNSSLSKGLNNMIINSSRTSVESIGNSIDNYIKMENLYLQDGKINSTATNYDNSNTNNNLTTTNNNNSNLPTNIKNSKSYKKNEKKENNLSKLIKHKDKKNITKNIINIVNNENNEEEEEEEKEKENNININNNIENEKHYVNSKKEKNNKIEDDNNNYNIDNKLIINYGALYSEAKQKMRNDKNNELKQKIINKLRPIIFDEIYKNEYDNILRKITQEFQIQLKEELEQKMIDELNYIKKKENFNQKIKIEQIDNSIKEKVKNEFEEELNKEIIIKDKEIYKN